MKVDLTSLDRLVEQKYLSRQEHWEAPLLIYNYTAKTTNDQYWTPETMMCRGLIVDREGNIVARPFPKFFNISEHESEKVPNLPKNEHFEVFDKLDGSLGILYRINNNPFIATRGSFASDQAVEATKILRHRYFDVVFNPLYTYLFEIIYPENRIVVDYKGVKDLYLIGVLNTETGEDMHKGVQKYSWLGAGKGPQNTFPEPEKFQFKDIEAIKEIMGKPETSTEGFVVRFSSGFRAKVKYDEYVRLHRLLTGVTARRIWDLLRSNQELKELYDRVPEEFKDWVANKQKELTDQFLKIEREAKIVFKKVKKLETRKEQADYIIGNYKYPSIIFSMLDEKDYTQIVWKIIRPKAEKPFYNDSEQA